MATSRRRTAALATVTLLAALAADTRAQPTESVWEFSSGLSPQQVCPSWTLVDTAPSTDPVSSVSGAFILTTAANAEDMYYVQTGFPVPTPDPLVVEARLRFISGSSSANSRGPAAIAISTAADTGVLFFVGTDEIFLTTTGDVRGQSAMVDTDDAAHTYRISITAAGAVTVLYDGASTLTGTTYTSATAFGPQTRIIWGEGSIQAFGSHAWESFRHNAATCPGATTSTTTSTIAPTTSEPTTSTTVVPVTTTSTTTVIAPTSSSTTLVVPTTSSTSTTGPTGPTTSTTTVAPPSTTTTITLPAECENVTPGSLDAIRCRLDILAAQIAERPGLGSFRAKLQSTLARAIMRAQEGDDACTAGDVKTARRRMKQTNRFLLSMAHRLSLLRARHQLDPGLRSDLIMMIESIRAEVVALRRAPCD